MLASLTIDADATLWALDAAACLIADLLSANYAQAAMDAVSLAGWVKLAML